MLVNSVNLQLMQHYKRPKYAVSLLLTAGVCYQNDSLETTHDEHCVRCVVTPCCAHAGLPHWPEVTTTKCFDYKELQISLGGWHHASVKASRWRG